ncbi:uncharacterized protein LOC134214166 [Armigeres subalbatus]|uniref:uncharacterized protein LOC134214166 n=1 Tax=Armigeres subalbatus TaxID=124917 RepID=UPI002ECFBF64
MISILVFISLVYSVVGHGHDKHVTIDNVKYSYGIFAPVGWTVGGYVWYISMLGLILGALVLLYFSKGWGTSGAYYDGFFNRRSLDYQRAFGAENGIFDHSSVQTEGRSYQLFWDDRIRDIHNLIRTND